MARRIGEAVAVRLAQDVTSGAGAGVAPASFIWRDRVYVVREVLGYWRERQAWWNAPAVRAAAVGEDLPMAVGAEGQALKVAVDHEREVWRVEARGPRTVGAGVYDISRETTRGTDGEGWRLLAVAD
ncbi:DUF6504 family protein [Spongisporangium articulatum]|uniref:DUF6504 family protein n=1 Tax=Spongisporangium articulatum TaxID=3362603 RepID=A0ABW8ASR8_9ACTN